MTVEEIQEYEELGIYAPIVPFKWQTGGYSTWNECYDHVSKTQQSPVTPKTQELLKNFFAKGGYNFLKQIEEDFNCAGICDVPLFFMTKNISEGSPK